jgi:prevent-host-death family protein
VKITSTEFANNLGRYQDEAQSDPVEITKHGRTHTVLVSGAFFESVRKRGATTPVPESPGGNGAKSEVLGGQQDPILERILRDYKPPMEYSRIGSKKI